MARKSAADVSTPVTPAAKKVRPSRYDWIFTAARSLGINPDAHWPADAPTLEDISAAKKAYRAALKAQSVAVIEAMKNRGAK